MKPRAIATIEFVVVLVVVVWFLILAVRLHDTTAALDRCESVLGSEYRSMPESPDWPDPPRGLR